MNLLSLFKHRSCDGPSIDHKHQWGVWGDVQEEKYESVGSRFGTLPGTNIAGYPWVHLQIIEWRQTRHCTDEQCHLAEIRVVHRNEHILRRFSIRDKVALRKDEGLPESGIIVPMPKVQPAKLEL